MTTPISKTKDYMYNLSDPEASSKFFEVEFDAEIDPTGMKALAKVDFKAFKGAYSHEKQYTSSREATQALLKNKERIMDILSGAKQQ